MHMTTSSLTEKQAKAILDFIANKLGYEAMYISVFADSLRVSKNSGGWRLVRCCDSVNNIDNSHAVYAFTYKQALKLVLGRTCMTSEPSCHPFTVPGSLEELLMQMDMES